MIHVCVVASDGPTDPPASTRDSKIEVCGKPGNMQPGKQRGSIHYTECMHAKRWRWENYQHGFGQGSGTIKNKFVIKLSMNVSNGEKGAQGWSGKEGR